MIKQQYLLQQYLQKYIYTQEKKKQNTKHIKTINGFSPPLQNGKCKTNNDNMKYLIDNKFRKIMKKKLLLQKSYQ